MKQPSKNTEGFFSRDQRQKGDERIEQEPVKLSDSKDSISATTTPVIIITPA